MSRSTTPVDPLEPEIRALRLRQRQLEAAADRGESADGWTRAQDALSRLEAGLQVNPPTPSSLNAVTGALATLRAVLRDGVAAGSVYREIRTNAETLRRLIDSTRRRGSAEDRYADRLADREARLEEAIQESGITRSRPPAGARRQARGRRAAGP